METQTRAEDINRPEETWPEPVRDFSVYLDRAAAFIRERPGACLLGAFGIGYVIGMIASRR